MEAANKQTKMSTITTLSNEAREKMDASFDLQERGLDIYSTCPLVTCASGGQHEMIPYPLSYLTRAR